ncbi:MAG: hypothetical protein A2068_01160 [Ignavibacteria bacterium GWB2_35_6b]|nr:MAG: hypothetical protein A2068_01160 [Ignavibacteria bacterium GWB2_35_6b]
MSAQNSIGINITRTQIIDAIKRMNKKDRTALVEDILASSSPEYLKSIREAREDYRKGRVFSHDEVFNSK